MHVAALFFAALFLFSIQGSTGANPKSHVYIMNPDCDGEFGKKLINDLKISISYRDYVQPFDISCAPTFAWLGFDGIRIWLMPILRFLHPADTFVFAYPESMRQDFQQYVLKYHRNELSQDEIRYIENGVKVISGHSNIALGFGFARGNHDEIRHEQGHLSVCGNWHDRTYDQYELGYIKKYPEGIGKPWCPQ